MDIKQENAAIEAVKKNDLHARCGTMSVKGEAAGLPGMVDVLCGCGVMLRVEVRQEAAAMPATIDQAKGEGRGRRTHVNEKDGE